jgi:hypothetical protein
MSEPSTRVGRALRAAALFLALGGGAAVYLYVKEVAPRDALRQAREEKKRLFHFGRDDVRAGTLYTRGATVAFERDGAGRFVLTAPVAWPADRDAIRALLDRMAVLRVERSLGEDPTEEELSSWGLAPPEIRLDVTLKSGEARSLLVGTKNPLVDAYPITDGARSRVGLTDPSFHWAFDRAPSDFRSRRLVPLAPSAIRSLQLARADGPDVRLRRESPDAPWRIETLGGPRTANPRRAARVVVAFTRRLEATGFLDDTLDWRFAAAEMRLTLETFDGEARQLRFLRGGPAVEDDTWVAHLEGTPTVAELDPSVERDLQIRPEALVDRTLSRFDPEAVASVKMHIGTEPPFVVVRDASGWAFSDASGETGPKPWRVDAVVRTFSLLEGEATHAEAPSAAQLSEWLLAPPSRRLVFRGEDGEILADVRVGNRLDEDHFLARAEGDPRVLTVPISKLRALPATRADLVE